MKAFFFDRDGIVNERLINQYVKTKDEFHFLRGFIDLFSLVIDLGFIPIVITNQQGIGKALMSENDLIQIHNYMQSELIKLTGKSFNDIFYCSELKDSNSFRRKPNPGMILEAIDKWGINPKLSWMIGDSISDSVAGKRANINTILIGNYLKDEVREADFIFQNINEAIEFVKTLVD